MGIDNPVHLVFLAAIALIVLGPKRLPEMARALGKGVREFRESMEHMTGGEGFMGEDHPNPQVVPLAEVSTPGDALGAQAHVPQAHAGVPQAYNVSQAYNDVSGGDVHQAHQVSGVHADLPQAPPAATDPVPGGQPPQTIFPFDDATVVEDHEDRAPATPGAS